MRFLNLLFLSSLLSFSAIAAAGDPVIVMNAQPQGIGSSLQSLIDQGMINGVYQDDDNNNRTDKMYYGVDFSFNSSFKKSDVDFMLNPTNGRIPQLFKDPMAIRKSGARYALETSFSAIIKTFHMNGLMDYSTRSSGDSTIHSFYTHSYNMFLYQNRIRVEVKEVGGVTKIRVLQVAAVKGSAQKKLDTWKLNGAFRGRVLANVKRMAQTLGKQ